MANKTIEKLTISKVTKRGIRMKSIGIDVNILVFVVVTGFLLLSAQSAMAGATATAETIHFRKDCTVDGSLLANCFEDTERSALLDWLYNTRKPNANSPLQLKIGAGIFNKQDLPRGKRFPLNIYCDASTGFTGYISIQGAGRSQTIIGDDVGYTLPVDACEGMVFKDLTIKATGNSGGAISWSGGGSSVWQNVDIESVYYGWISNSCGAERGKHYWFDSRISNVDNFSQATAYREECDVSWFIGSEIQNTAAGISGAPTVFRVRDGGEVHVYGSVIRSHAPDLISPSNNVAAARVSNGGNLHIHGTGIDVLSAAANNIVVLEVTSGGHVHANETAYNLSTAAGGSITRISNVGGIVKAPYLWQNAAEAPDITSITGADMAVIENTTDGHPHFAIYDSGCASNWYDTTINACR